MEMAPAIYGTHVSPVKTGGISYSFVMAVGLHLAGIVLLALAIRHWPAVRLPPPSVGMLELEVAQSAPRAPIPLQVPTLLEQAVTAIPAESRTCEPFPAPVPESRGPILPEPMVSAPAFGADAVCLPSPPPVGGGVSVALPAASPGRAVAAAGDSVGRGSPIALSDIKPRYPYSARTRGETGRVTVHIHVSSQGEVESVNVGESSGFASLDESAVAAARKARFKPAERDGKPVFSEMNLQFDFRLEDR